jgi:hypothetical protein
MSSAPVYPRLEPGAFTCPACGARTSDPQSIATGRCGICGQYTGLCQVGRDPLLAPPPGTPAPPGWDRPCPEIGTAWWHLRRPGGKGPGWDAAHLLLCPPHNSEALYLPWVTGIPVHLGDGALIVAGLTAAAKALEAGGYTRTAAAVAAQASLLVSASHAEGR